MRTRLDGTLVVPCRPVEQATNRGAVGPAATAPKTNEWGGRETGDHPT